MLKSIMHVDLTVSFPSASLFRSYQNKRLADRFLDTPVYSYAFGPVIVYARSGKEASDLRSLFQQGKLLQSQNNVVIQVLKASYLQNYLINIHFIAQMMLVNLTIPQYWYELTKLVSSTIWLKIPNYMSYSPTYETPPLPIGRQIDETTIPRQRPGGLLNQFSQSSNFLVNAFTGLACQAIFFMIFGLVGGLYRYKLRRMTPSELDKSYTGLFLRFSFSWVIKSYESTCLIVVISILLQFRNYNFETPLNTISFVCAILFTLKITGLFSYACYAINCPPRDARSRMYMMTRFSSLIGDLRYEQVVVKRPRSLLRKLERLCIINYHMLGLLKKWLISVVIVTQQQDPSVQISFLICVNVFFLVLTLWLRPYYIWQGDVVKVVQDAILTAYCVLYYDVMKLIANMASQVQISTD